MNSNENPVTTQGKSDPKPHAVVSGEKKLGGKYLTFILANEEYGLEILKVREIIGLLEITMVPRMPSFVRGVINLRGKVIPVIDLRNKFGLSQVENTKQTCIIVVDVVSNASTALMGIIVDTVSEVVDIIGNEIEQAPMFGAAVDTTFILGIAKIKGSVKLLLHIDKILSPDEISGMSKMF